jgi:ATP-dependent DNA helicase DinG
MRAAPVDVAERLGPLLFAEGKTAVLTSATLGTGDPDLSYFRQRIGGEQVEALQIGSPFNYREQMNIHVVKSMPDPTSAEYGEALAKWTERFLHQSDGRAFVLFTSYRSLQLVAKEIEGVCRQQGWQLLIQGKKYPRHRLLQEFRDDERSVLLGTDSFWTGVDVPGNALSNVIVTRLPFAVPDHPLTAARLERIEEKGGNPFMNYSVPEAVIKLRQGVGRLIRSSRDRGMVVILDNRVVTRRYGKTFLEALPDAPIEIVDQPLEEE